MSRPQNKNVIVMLSCEHTLMFALYSWAPRKGERVWCPRCADLRRVLEAPPEFRARCRSCTYSRATGRDKALAMDLAKRHHGRRGHAVDVRDGRLVVLTVGTVEHPTLDDETFEKLSAKGLDMSRLQRDH